MSHLITRTLLEASLALTPAQGSPFIRCPNCGQPAQVIDRGPNLYTAPTCCHSLRHPDITRTPDQVVRARTSREGFALALELPEPGEIAVDRERWSQSVVAASNARVVASMDQQKPKGCAR
jgi:hypothetical protein